MKTNIARKLMEETNIDFNELLEILPTEMKYREEVISNVIIEITTDGLIDDLNVNRKEIEEFYLKLNSGEKLDEEKLFLLYIKNKGEKFYINKIYSRKNDIIKEQLMSEKGYELGSRVNYGQLTIDDRITMINDSYYDDNFGRVFQLYSVEVDPRRAARDSADVYGTVDNELANSREVLFLSKITLRDVNNHNVTMTITRDKLNENFQYVNEK